MEISQFFIRDTSTQMIQMVGFSIVMYQLEFGLMVALDIASLKWEYITVNRAFLCYVGIPNHSTDNFIN